MGVHNVTGTIKDTWHSETSIRYRLNGYVLGTAILLASIMTLRALRNRTGWPVVKFCLMAACYLSPHALSYVLGKLSDYPFDNELMARLIVVWAVFLIVLDGMTYNSGSDSLEDNEATRKRFLWDKMIPSLWFLLLLVWDFPLNILCIPLIVLWLLYLLKLSERKQALMYACRSQGGLDQVTMVIAEYMELMEEKHANESCSDSDYKYMVGVKQALDQVVSHSRPPRHVKDIKLDKITTIDDVWNSKGRLFDAAGDRRNDLKDNCLSFALFWLLLRRFGDHELAEMAKKESRDKCWKLVRKELIEDEGDGERAYKVVEVELQFLHDYLFNNYFAVYGKGSRFLLVRLVVFLIYLFVCFLTVRFIHFYEEVEGRRNAQIIITELIIYTLSLVELVQIINLFTSRWNKVKWTCSYVQKRWWETATKGSWEYSLGRFKEVLLGLLCLAPCFRPWHRTLRQYSLLDSYGHNPLILKLKFILDGYIEFPMRGQKEGPPIDLSGKVKNAVIASLLGNEGRLSNGSGVASLKSHGVLDRWLSWGSKQKSTSRIVLVWHIATSICEMDSKNEAQPSGDHLDVATSLSKYCAYLVAFAPNLLPDHVYITQWLFEEVVFETTAKLKKCHSEEHKYDELTRLSDPDDLEGTLQQDKHSILELGALLGMNLIKGIKLPTDRWKVLADFWAEMILYLAPSKDAAAHAEYLAAGGEFITHLWALLTHAGIVDREDGL